jgi:hypothetical protein
MPGSERIYMSFDPFLLNENGRRCIKRGKKRRKTPLFKSCYETSDQTANLIKRPDPITPNNGYAAKEGIKVNRS